VIELEKLRVVTRYELLKQVRRKRFYGALVIALLAVGLTAGLYEGLDLAKSLGIETLLAQWDAEVFTLFMTGMSALAVLAAVFFAGDAVAGEFERKTGYILFPNPVRRSTLVVGKYLACLIATVAILLAAYALSALLAFGFYGEVPLGIFGSLAVTLAMAACVLSLAFAFSSALRGGMGATVATLLTFIVIFPIISGSLAYAGYDPWFMPDRAGDAAGAAYGVPLENFTGMFGGGAMEGMLRASSDPTLSFFVLAVYAAGLFFLSLFLAGRREMV